MSIDPALPPNLVEELRDMRRRLRVMETTSLQISQPIPKIDIFPINSSGYHESPNASPTSVNTGRCAFSAQYLHYYITSSTSLLGGGATQNVYLGTAVEGASSLTNTLLTELTPGLYQGALDLYAIHGEASRNKSIQADLVIERVGGTGSAQAGYASNLLLRVHDFTFYGG